MARKRGNVSVVDVGDVVGEDLWRKISWRGRCGEVVALAVKTSGGGLLKGGG